MNSTDKSKMINKAERCLHKLIEIFQLSQHISSEHIDDTPKRVAKMLFDKFSGLYYDPPEIKLYTNKDRNVEQYATNIELKSTCCHHLVAFAGKCSIIYMPDKHICGLSKIPRYVKHMCKKPQIQETLTSDIAYGLYQILKPVYLVVVTAAKHGCITQRGVNQDVTNYMNQMISRHDMPNLRQQLVERMMRDIKI